MLLTMVGPGGLVEQPIWYTIIVRVQQGRYRYWLTDYQLARAGKLLPLESQLAPTLPQQERQANETRFMPVSLHSKAVIIGLQAAMRKPVARPKKADPLAPYKVGFPGAGSPQR
ncbi:hypothetical protein BXP70_26495 [Hymenobacter crusticola]|uniref:Uncharacterized protein n=2 Tax=Hymenobacter crusticola TaxID=1770526 RepID=A0A243W5Y8_9BACT|nr:hypothetical protein BXP70_26495 [Hymenobacter crusticola]